VVSRLVPAAARGEAMGWHGSALTAGLALGAPIAGAAIDAGSPAWGFAAVGAVGALATLVLATMHRRLERDGAAGRSPGDGAEKGLAAHPAGTGEPGMTGVPVPETVV
jgi:predicted MFS family arabinose efflux permease